MQVEDVPVRWLLPSTEKVQGAPALQDALGLHPIVARVLAHRGLATPEQAKAFLDDRLEALPDPWLLKGLEPAVDRLCKAVLEKHTVALYGDYDVDGVCSTTLITLLLRALGLAPITYIPHRLAEGYGLNPQAIERLAARGVQLLVTLDCGITSHPEVALAGKLGLDTIVVDHHAVPEVMPPALAVLNPLQPGCQYPTKGLCAAGVAFNLCLGLRKTLRERGFFAGKTEPNLKQLLDLVALATVADVVPLTGANRVLVRHGLEQLTKGHRPGVKALKQVAGLDLETITASHVGFRLGPRINAAGRLADASLGLQLLLSTSLEEALPKAQALDEANAERQNIEKQILAEALEQAAECVARGAKGLVLWSDDWHPGVVGIVASRVVERFHRPTVLVGIHDGVGRGSARSIEGFHVNEALAGCKAHLVKCGGHRAAAGVTVEPAALPAFRAAFEAIAAQKLEGVELGPKCRIDAVASPLELEEGAAQAIAALAPFGMGNPEPVLMLEGQLAQGRILQSKKEGESGHLKLALDGAPHVDVIGFRLADRLPQTAGLCDLAFQLSVDEWRGVRRLQLKLKDVRSSPGSMVEEAVGVGRRKSGLQTVRVQL